MAFILTVFFVSVSNINAEEYRGTIEKGESIKGVYYYKTREDTEDIIYPTHSFHEQAHIYYDSINHNIVYCIESWQSITGATTNDYRVFNTNVQETNLTDDIIEEINLIAYYGYGYKDDKYDHTTPEWYALTQLLIWQLQAPTYKHYIVSSISSTKPNYTYDSQMNEIKRLVRKHKNKPSLFNSKLKINTTKENEDITGNLKYYEIESCDDGIDVTIEDEKAIIKSLNKAGEFSYILRRKYNKWNKKMKIYISDNFQNVLEPGDMEDDVVTKKITVEAFTLSFAVNSLVPHVLNEDGKESYITHFFPDIEVNIIAKKDIYDGAGNLVYKKGYIYSKTKSVAGYSSVSIVPGTFELQVTTNIPGFKSESKVVGIKNQNVTTSINLKRSTFVINVYKALEKMQDNGLIAKVPGENISFGLYAGENIKNLSGDTFIEGNRLIETLSTDELGKIRKIEEFLLPGKYYLKEITELDNYEPNDQKYEFELVYGEKYQDYIEIEEILIENKLKTGKVSIKKLDADEYFPLENVTYSLYSKDKSLLATASTNSSGEVDFDVKIGEYFIKENTALDGYIRDDKTYYVNIDYTNLNPSYKMLNEKILKEEPDKTKDEPTEPKDPIDKPEDPKDEPVEPNDPVEKPEEPTEKPDDLKEKPELPKEEDEDEKGPIVITPSEDENENIDKIIDEEVDKGSNEGDGLIVNVPSTNVYDYSLILLFLLNITIISLLKCLKNS